jgi:phage-related protein
MLGFLGRGLLGVFMKKQNLKDEKIEVKSNKMSFNQLKEMNISDIRQILKEHERIVVIISSEMMLLEVRELDV